MEIEQTNQLPYMSIKNANTFSTINIFICLFMLTWWWRCDDGDDNNDINDANIDNNTTQSIFFVCIV